MPKKHTIPLATGTLHLNLIPGKIPLHRLLGFAARVSSKRKFLLVSKVLGKHYPVSPKMMAWSYRALARLVLKQKIAAPSLWIGMAETATGLGYGVFAAACHEGVQDALFMQTTRYVFEGCDRLEFEEAHSHATDFFLYYPEQTINRQLFQTARTLVLVDDEISTGKTFLRLIKAYQVVNPQLEKVFIVSLVNFAHAADRHFLETESGVEVEWVCFREGVLHFDDSHNAALDGITINVSGNGGCKKHLLAWPGRFGMAAPLHWQAGTLERLLPLLGAGDADPRPVLVLGTGECNPPAIMLGRELERAGYKVKVQSTTRSPIHPGNAIGSVCQFTDNYDDNIPNFLYNLDLSAYRQIILCHETPLNDAVLSRLHAWQAISARFQLTNQSTHDATLHFFRP
ncbi:MAG: phosphoribosyltransferase domain-containing protein [Methylovulum sp.]|uniref:phosphoribosyltransferase domain-containing protein n=1 Tax=Methylovulum sp. TaxID=1916980 RepID=UPI00261A6E51|nr:phosphoribosyltransferase domain-containing protein [Methylovulum sp.]MDD2724400.1 phosphoribosyltransferase domain-containing protein [Methylovulum sp.]MDD5124015.1 phosphoribosyltransferase domain-containing protein [Methylovulum sp.]